jgi:hypothetical protein
VSGMKMAWVNGMKMAWVNGMKMAWVSGMRKFEIMVKLRSPINLQEG